MQTSTEFQNGSLSHYGVLGMKWGVRKDRSKVADKKAAKERKALAKAAKKMKAESGWGQGPKLNKAEEAQWTKAKKEWETKAAEFDKKNDELDKIEDELDAVNEQMRSLSFEEVDRLGLGEKAFALDLKADELANECVAINYELERITDENWDIFRRKGTFIAGPKIDHSDSSPSLTHYGIKGMKWGVRRTPEQLGHKPAGAQTFSSSPTKPTYSERKERRKRTKDLAAAQKYVKIRTEMYEGAKKASDAANAEYGKALSKTVLPWNKKKKQDAIDAASEKVQKRMTDEQETRWKADRALNIGKEKEKALSDYVDALTEKYGIENVKQLKPKQIAIGETFVIDTFKTGPRAENFPILGNSVSAKKINQWERQIREEIAEKRSESMQKNRYA